VRRRRFGSRKVLPHPVKDEWAPELFAQGLKKGLIDQLETGVDCLAGLSAYFDKGTGMMNDLLEQSVVVV
jgi:hypothetical protein